MKAGSLMFHVIPILYQKKAEAERPKKCSRTGVQSVQKLSRTR